MPEPRSIPSSSEGHWSERLTAKGDETFHSATMKAGGITPLQVAMKRRWEILVFAGLVSAVVGLAVRQLPVKYTANTSVMVDLRQPRLSTGESLLPSQIVDLELLHTYMEALRSPELVKNVVKQLNLTTMPEYCAQPSGWTRILPHLLARPLPHDIGAGSLTTCHTSAEKAAKRLAPAVGFSNDSHSYVISIGATADNANLAANIANAYASAFIARRRQQQAELTDQADTWLHTHLAQLRTAVLAADNAVEQQRRSGQLTSLQGQTLLGQSLLEMNRQLIVATGDLAQKQSTLRELENAARSGTSRLGASAPVLTSPIIQGLLGQESNLASTQAELSTRFGSANLELVANAAQLKRVRQQVRMEIMKAVDSLSGEVEALVERRKALENRVQDLQRKVDDQGIDETRLQDLERDAVSARGRYDEASLRLEQIRVESAMQRADVQLVVEASPPDFPSFPRTKMIITGTFLAMMGVGAALAYALELLSRVFSTPEQVEEQTGLHVLGLFPKFASARSRLQDAAAAQPAPLEAEALQALVAGLIGTHNRCKTKRGCVLMVTSAMPGEGKTSFSVALGRAVAARGLSVVMVDCDLRRSSLRSHFPLLAPIDSAPEEFSREHGAEPRLNFAELAADPSSGMHVMLPRLLSSNPHAVLASVGFPHALEELRANHDVVIIDTPPVLAVPDAMNIAPLADKVVMLVGWRSTPRSAVLAALKVLGRAHIQVSGVVLSKVDLRRFARANRDSSYYAKLYPAYHAPLRG